MELRNLLKKKPSGQAVINELFLDHLRYIKFLENTRVVMNLLDDGREKACGEYILDVHYVEALIEETMRYLGRMVFDACVIRQKGGESLFIRYDQEQAKARRILLNIQKGVLPGRADSDEEPEYALLKEVLDTFYPSDSKARTGVVDLVYDLINHMMARTVNPKFPFNETPSWVIPCQGHVHHVHLLPVGDGQPLTGSFSLTDSPCRPLRVLFSDALPTQKPAGPDAVPVHWAAITNGPYLSMGFREGNRILCQLDICLSGDRDMDYVFAFMHDRMMPEPLVPEGFETSKTGEGLLAWCYNRPVQDMEDLIARLGNQLFINPRGLEQIISSNKEMSHA